MEDRKKNIILGIIAVIVIITLIFLNRDNLFKKNPTIISGDITMVTDNNRFYTVTSCVSKYLSYLSSGDSSSLLLLLDNDYKETNNITSSNIYQFIDRLDSQYEFNADKMYQEKVNDTVIKYYVSGSISPALYFENMEDSYNVEYREFYVIVNLDLRQGVFSIVPYDGDIFLNGGAS